MTEQRRKECEARHVLSWPAKQARRDYLDLVEKKRGFAARQELEREMMRQWKEQKN